MKATDEAGTVLLEQDVPCEIQLPLAVQVASKFLTHQMYGLTLVASDLFEMPEKAVARFELLSEGKPVRTAEAALKERSASADLDVKALPPGDYAVRASVLDGDAVKGTQTVSLTIPRKPAWFTDPVGHTDSVLPPWTPVEVQGNDVKVWGRTYSFGADSPFPTQIVSKARGLLKETPRIVLEGAEDGLQWKRGAIRQAEHEASFRCEDTTGILTASAEVTVAYEGLNRIVVNLTPQAPVRLKEAYFEFALDRNYVNLASVYHGEDDFRKKTPALLASEGAVGPLSEAVTFNDMQTGVQWFIATPRSDWPVKNRKRMMEIRPEADRVRLRVKIADTPVTLDRPVRLDTAFIAMPVRPKQADPITWYLGIGPGPGAEKKEEFDDFLNIHYPAHGNVDPRAGTLEFWLRPSEGKAPGQIVTFLDRSKWVALTAGEKDVGLAWNAGPSNWPRRRLGEVSWTPGEWAHLLLLWEGVGGTPTRVTAWVNGKRVGTIHADAPSFDTYTTRLFVGGVQGAYKSEFDLDALRIASGSVDDAEATRRASAPPGAVPGLLLLDTFDQEAPVNSVVETPAEKISGRSGERGGIPHFLCTYVDGRHGKALSLRYRQTHAKLDIMQRIGWRGFYLHNWGYDQWGYWDITDPARAKLYKDFAAEAVKRGMVYMTYFCNFLSSLDKENYVFKAEMEKIPGMALSESIMVNIKRPAQDFVVWQIKNAMEEFGVTGLHLDFHAGYFPDRNEIVGDGWRDAAGNLFETWDYHDMWTQQRRIYALCKESPLKNGVIMIHAGPTAVPWCDYRMTGEGSRTMEAVLPLDAYRTACTEGPTGLPKMFDAKYTHKDHNEMLAVSLLHNDPCRPTTNPLFVDYIRRATLQDPYSERARPQCLLMSLRDYFGMAQAEFVPYWENIPVRTMPDHLVSSLWRIPGRRTLAVVSNLTRAPVKDAAATFDLAALGLRADSLAVFDAYTRVNLPRKESTVTVDLDEANYRLIWLEALR